MDKWGKINKLYKTPEKGLIFLDAFIHAGNLKNLSINKGEPMSVFTAVVYKEDTLYVAQCPEVGSVSQGNSIEEAIENLQEATALFLEEFPIKQISRPFMTTFEVPSHA